MATRLPDPHSSNALIIGAANFASDAITDLPSVANNISALAEALTDPAAGVVDPARCRQLINPRAQHEVGAALDETVHAASDTAIVYYAGHGLLTPRGALHLAVADTDPNHVVYTAVPIEWLRLALAESPAKNRILILDCCFSGHAATAMTSVSSALTAAIDISGTYTVTSAPANSTSIAPPGDRYTAFTGELLRVLRDGIPGAGGLLSMRDIYTALVRGLHARSMPRPQHLGTGLADHISLGPNVADGPTRPTPRPTAIPPKHATARTTEHISTPPADTAALEKQFHQALVDGYRAMKRDINYNATIYIRMISTSGGLGAARQLLHASSVSSGFTTLWEKNASTSPWKHLSCKNPGRRCSPTKNSRSPATGSPSTAITPPHNQAAETAKPTLRLRTCGPGIAPARRVLPAGPPGCPLSCGGRTTPGRGRGDHGPRQATPTHADGGRRI